MKRNEENIENEIKNENNKQKKKEKVKFKLFIQEKEEKEEKEENNLKEKKKENKLNNNNTNNNNNNNNNLNNKIINVSQEYFEKVRTLRNGLELFNVTGDKFKVLKDVIEKNEKKIKDREELKHAPPYQVRRVNELLEIRKLEMVRKRLRNLPITDATKYAISGDEFKLREELDKGYPINFRDGTTGRTLLHEASVNGHLPIVRMLCREYKARTNVYTVLGNVNPLHLSVGRNYRQISVILCQNQVDPNHQDLSGSTPLHYVQSKTVLKLLLRYGSDPRIRNNAGQTPREYYISTVEGYRQDPFILKRLLQIEEAYAKEEYKKQLYDLQDRRTDDSVAETTFKFDPLKIKYGGET